MQTGKNYRKQIMIIEDIKNSIKNIIYSIDNKIIFHFEEISHTGFPYAVFSLKDFKTQSFSAFNKQKLYFSFELIFQKSEDNKLAELFDMQEKISKALLPAIKILGKFIALDDVRFSVLNKQLVLNFDLNFYAFENNETNELMQTLDLTIKEDKNA